MVCWGQNYRVLTLLRRMTYPRTTIQISLTLTVNLQKWDGNTLVFVKNFLIGI